LDLHGVVFYQMSGGFSLKKVPLLRSGALAGPGRLEESRGL
jgi:hypothetical protein